MQQVEHEIDEAGAAPPFRGVLDQRKGCDAVGPHPAKLTVEIRLPRRDRAECRGDRRVFAGPVEPGTGQQADIAAIDPGVHAISVEFELVAPLVAGGGFLHELAELRLDPCGKSCIRLRVR